MPMLTEE
jgi:hypothetical protein